MNNPVLKLQRLEAASFAPFGDVIQTSDKQAEIINYGQTEKFADLARLQTGTHGGRTGLHLFRSKPVELPFRLEIMERHPLGSQAFIPLHDRPFLVVVAAAGAAPENHQLKGFYTDGKQGVNYHPGVWHHYQLSLFEVSEYLVIDRCGGDANFDEHRLAEPVLIQPLPF